MISQSCSSTSRYLCNNIFLAWLEENGLNEFFCRSQITTLDYHYHHIGWIEHELPWWENMYGLVWYLPTYMFRKDIPSGRCGQGAKMMYLFGSSILISVKGAISSHLSKVVMEKWPNKWPSVYYKNLNCTMLLSEMYYILVSSTRAEKYSRFAFETIL